MIMNVGILSKNTCNYFMYIPLADITVTATLTMITTLKKFSRATNILYTTLQSTSISTQSYKATQLLL